MTSASAAPPQAAPAAPSSVSFAIPTAGLSPAQVGSLMIPMGTYYSNGNYYYTQWVYSNGTPVLTGNIRFSWSYMWKIKNGWTTNAAAAALVCGFMPTGVAKTACGLYVLYVGVAVRSKVNTAISHSKCLTVRFALPPYPFYRAAGWWEVTCTR